MADLDPWTYAEKYKTEHANQAALFMWANMAWRFGLLAASYPASYSERGFAAKVANNPVQQLKWLHAVHNQGHGDKIRGGRAKAEGVKAGVADMFLPIVKPDSCQAGLYIELKVDKGTVSPIQSEFAFDIRNAGYAHCFAWGWEQARDYILKYLGLDNV